MLTASFALTFAVLVKAVCSAYADNIGLLLSNGTTYISIDEIINLESTTNYSLALLNPERNTAIKTSLIQMYKEYKAISYHNETFVDSFGFRMGDVSQRAYQLVISQDNIYLYTLASVSNELSLQELKKWNVNSTINNKTSSKYYKANSTSAAIKIDDEIMDFVLLTVQNGTVNEQISVLRIACSLTKKNEFDCKLSLVIRISIPPLYFINTKNSSDVIRCESSLRALSGDYTPRSIDQNPVDFDYYFARFCKLSQLPIAIQKRYQNEIQIFTKTAINELLMIGRVDKLNMMNNTFALQLVEFAEFRDSLIYFIPDLTFTAKIGPVESILIVTQWFENPDSKETGYVECQQNSLAALSCFMFCYSSDSSNGPKENPLNSFSDSVFTEFISLQQKIFRIPPINLQMIDDTDRITAINSNFIVFRDDETFKNQLPKNKTETKLKILRRGTSNQLGELQVSGEIIAMKGMGENFILYRESDIGVVIKKTVSKNNTEDFTVAIYTAQLPVFKIDAQFANSSYLCFNYVKGCQYLEFNLSYSPTYKDSDANTTNKGVSAVNWYVLPFYIINNNFTGILPKRELPVIELGIFRDKLTLNITDFYYGLPVTHYARSVENSPGISSSSLNVTITGEAFADALINITSVDVSNLCKNVQSIKPYVVVNSQGNLFIAIQVECRYVYSITNIIFLTPDFIDLQEDTDFSFAWNNLDHFILEYSFDKAVLISNDQLALGFFYLLYDSTRPERSFKLTQFSVYEGTIAAETFWVPYYQLTPIAGMTLKVLRSPGSKADNAILLFSSDQVMLYMVQYHDPAPQRNRLDFSLVLKFSTGRGSLDWPVGTPLMIKDVFIADFNALYVRVLVKKPEGSTTEVLQVHQCDIGEISLCYFYTYVELKNCLVIVDDITFNFILIDRDTLQMYYYRVADFKRDFISLVKHVLLPSRTNNLKQIMKDPSLKLADIYDPTMIMPSNIEVLSLAVTSSIPENNGFLIFNLKVQSVTPVRFVPSASVSKMKQIGVRNADPYQYPMIYQHDKDNSLLEIKILNSAVGLTLKTPPYLASSTSSETFETEIFEAVLSNPSSPDFVQSFKGVSYFNFNLDIKQSIRTDNISAEISDLASGFLQNTTIYCMDGSLADYHVTRNFSISLECNSKADKKHLGSYLLTPYISKDYDFFWGKSSYLDQSKNQGVHLSIGREMANITSSFRLNNSDEFVFLFHQNITILHTRDTSKIVAFIEVIDKDSTNPVDYSKCLSVSEATFINETIELELVCAENSDVYIYNFTLGLDELRDSTVQSPSLIRKKATRWYVVDILMSQIYSKSLKAVYMGKLLYVMDSIVLESYNNKPYLNIYQVFRLSNSKYLDLKLVWSSLSRDEFADHNIVEFSVVRDLPDRQMARNYILQILMEKVQSREVIYIENEVMVYPNDKGTEDCLFKLLGPIDLKVSYLLEMQFFLISPDSYFYGITDDSILEWKIENGVPKIQDQSYKYLDICSDASKRQIFKLVDNLLLYCYNSTSDSSYGDSVILYNKRVNTKDGSIFPVQQMNIPDVDFPSNLFLSAQISNGVPKFLIANSRTFITQYQINSESRVYWQHPEYKGEIDLKVGLVASNILSSALSTLNFKIRLYDIATQYLHDLNQSLGLIVTLVAYFIGLSCLLSLSYIREKEMGKTDVAARVFVQNYKDIVENKNNKLQLEHHDPVPISEPLGMTAE